MTFYDLRAVREALGIVHQKGKFCHHHFIF